MTNPDNFRELSVMFARLWPRALPGPKLESVQRSSCFRPARYYSLSSTFDKIATVKLDYDVWKPSGPAVADSNIERSSIVFLHGLFGSRANNRAVSRVLARDLKKNVYCLDLRNHGTSPHIQRHDYVSLAADVSRFITEHRLNKPIVIGHSMGARTAMALALERPDQVSDLIPVDNGPVPGRLSPDFAMYIRAMREIDWGHVKRQIEADKILMKYESSPAKRLYLLANFKKEGEYYKCRMPLEILGRALDHMGEFFFDPSKVRFTGPTLLIRGTKSGFVPDEQLPLMGQLFPRFVVEDIDAGHWVISDNPNEFIAAVEKFLDQSE